MSVCIQIFPQTFPIVRAKKQGTLHTFVQDVEGTYTCHYCDFKSLKKSTVSEHISRIHPKEAGRQINPFECKHCGAKFQNKSAELHHVKTHHEITMVRCPYDGCVYEAKNNTTLCTHYSRKHMPELTISTVSADVVECTICKKSMKKTTAPYHVAKCYSLSPFFTGSVMQDGTDEIFLFKPVF
jgi:hypothetical protein